MKFIWQHNEGHCCFCKRNLSWHPCLCLCQRFYGNIVHFRKYKHLDVLYTSYCTPLRKKKKIYFWMWYCAHSLKFTFINFSIHLLEKKKIKTQTNQFIQTHNSSWFSDFKQCWNTESELEKETYWMHVLQNVFCTENPMLAPTMLFGWGRTCDIGSRMMLRTPTAHSVNRQKCLCADVFMLICLCVYERRNLRVFTEQDKCICGHMFSIWFTLVDLLQLQLQYV